jgi:hypothetical protein
MLWAITQVREAVDLSPECRGQRKLHVHAAIVSIGSLSVHGSMPILTNRSS